jgi:hypothetical protein
MIFCKKITLPQGFLLKKSLEKQHSHKIIAEQVKHQVKHEDKHQVELNDKPNSRLQKYRLTESGVKRIEE